MRWNGSILALPPEIVGGLAYLLDTSSLCGVLHPNGPGAFFFDSSNRLGEILPRKPFIHTLTDMAFCWRMNTLRNSLFNLTVLWIYYKLSLVQDDVHLIK